MTSAQDSPSDQTPDRCSSWVSNVEGHGVHQCRRLANADFGGARFCSPHATLFSRKVDAQTPPERVAALYRFDAECMKPEPLAEIPVPPQPMKWTLYRMYDDDALLYVGISGRGARRFTEHRGNKTWWINVTTIRVEHYDSVEMARDAEEEAIWNEKPLHNIRHNASGVRETSEIPA